jgi:hypothetical protein
MLYKFWSVDNIVFSFHPGRKYYHYRDLDGLRPRHWRCVKGTVTYDCTFINNEHYIPISPEIQVREGL